MVNKSENKMEIGVGCVHASFWLIIFILFSTDSMLVSTNSSRLFAKISWILIIAFFSFNANCLRLTLKEILYLFSFSCFMLLSGLINDGGFEVNYVQRALLLWVAVLVVKSIPYEDYIKSYIHAINFIAAFSMICWVLHGVILDIPFIPSIYTGEFSYKSLFFTNISPRSIRNYGPFWEPGAFQLFINFAIFLQIREKKYFNKKSLFLLVVTLLTTLSSSGIAILLLIFLYFLVAKKNSSGANIFVLKFLSIIFLIGFVFFLLNSNYGNDVFGKIYAYIDNPLEKNSANVSAYTRFNSVGANISMIMQKPLFGWGISQSKEVLLNNFYLTSNPNTILGCGSSYGIFVMALYCFLIIRGAISNSNNVILNFIYLIIWGIMLSVESLLVSLPFFIFLFYESRMFVSQNSHWIEKSDVLPIGR